MRNVFYYLRNLAVTADILLTAAKLTRWKTDTMPKFNATIKIGEANFEAEDMEDEKEKIRSADFKIEGTDVEHIDPKYIVLRQIEDKGNKNGDSGE